MRHEHNIRLPFSTSHAFIIGINEYEQVSRLTTAVNDAEVLAQKLADEHGYTVFPPLLDANKADILKLFQEDMPKLIQEDDRVFLYFAGHGIALNSDDDPKGYLVPADASPGDIETLISMDLLHQTIMDLKCKHGMLIMDCCFAGAFRWSTGQRDVVFDLPGIIYEERFYQYARDQAWQVITSSASDQKAVDILSNRTLGLRNEEGENHSPFARALFDGLDGAGDTIPKGRGDGVITAVELYSYLRDRVEDETTEHGKRQSPSMFSLHRHGKGQYIFLDPDHRLNLPPIPRRNPFMGLKSYDETDTELFYGRDRVISALDKQVSQHQLLVVAGASGTGKSSVIKAGLLPSLRDRKWNILPVIRPGKEPLINLKEATSDIKKLLRKRKPTVLVIDQYEELITQCIHPEERIAFESTLASWLSAHSKLHIVISIRSDFEPQFESSALAPWWQKGRYVVPAFSQFEIREVIIKPTTQEVLFFEPDALVDKLVDAVNQAPGAMPLLSFTLSELYHAYINSGRTNRAFTLKDYEKLGGVIGALRTRANQIYDELDEAHQKSMQKFMLRMVSFEGRELTGKRVGTEELIFNNKRESERLQKVASLLLDARLIVKGLDAYQQPYIEPAHDALIRAWAKLWEWIREVGDDQLFIRKQLWEAVQQYKEHDRAAQKQYSISTSLLWDQNPKLDQLLSILKKDPHAFNAAEESFIRKSNAIRKENIEKLKQERDYAVSVALSAKAIQMADQNASVAIRIAEMAYAHSSPPSLESQEALIRIFYSQHRFPLYQMIFREDVSHINAVAINQDGTMILTGSSDYSAKLWSVCGKEICHLTGHIGPVKAVSFSQDEQFILTGSTDKTIKIWTKEGKVYDILEGHQAGINALACSPDGKYLVSGSEDKSAIIWDLETKEQTILTGNYSAILACSFSPNSRYILTAGRDTSVRLWNLEGKELQAFWGHQDAVLSVCFSPDGKTFLSGSSDKTARLWQHDKTKQIGLLGHTSPVNAAIFTPDGKRIRTASSEGNTILWNRKGDKINQEQRHRNSIIALSYAKDGGYLLSASTDDEAILWHTKPGINAKWSHPDIVWSVSYFENQANKGISRNKKSEGLLCTGCDDGKARIWNLEGELLHEIEGHASPVLATAIHPSGKYMLSGSTDGTVILSNHKGKEITRFTEHSSKITYLSFTPLQEQVLSCSYDGMIHIWSFDGKKQHTFDQHQAGLRFATFCPDERTVISGGMNQQIIQWDFETQEIKNEFLPKSSIRSIAVSSNGKYILTGNDHRTAAIRDREGTIIQTLIGHQKAIHAVRFSPDDRFIITGSADETIKVWDLNGRMIQSFPGHRSYVRDLVFSEDGSHLYSTGDSDVKKWWMPKKVYDWLKTAPVYKLTDQERKSYEVIS